MEANCMLYRANRLAPVALNCPALCDALGDDLNRLISEYWDAVPTTNIHFLAETDRFCRFLTGRGDLPAGASETLAREHAAVVARLAASGALAGQNAFVDPQAGMAQGLQIPFAIPRESGDPAGS